MLEKMTMEICHNYLDTQSQKDTNGNGIECDIIVFLDPLTGQLIIDSDTNVDEDPNEEKYVKEAGHRAFILGIGKFGIVYLLGIFLPLFLATGLIREEMSDGTIHYMYKTNSKRRSTSLQNVRISRNHLAVHNCNLSRNEYNHWSYWSK